EWNETRAEYPRDKSIQAVFEEQAARTPLAVAVEFEGEALSYRELNERANRLAHYLQKYGAGPDAPVGVCLERSLDMMVSVLGILKAGAAYLPLDPGLPKERLAFMREDAAATLVVSHEKWRALFTQLAETAPKDGRAPKTALICLDSCREAIASQSQANPAS